MRISDWSSDVCSSDLAPVRSTGGRIYGNTDPVCDCDDPPTYAALARFLPARPVLVTSHLQRTHQTANAIREAGLSDRQRVVSGKRGSVRVDLGGRRIIKNKPQSSI